MPTERSVAEVEELKTLFTDASVLISTDYRGLDVATMNALRRALQKSGVRYRISKNTLSRLAADELDRPEIKDLVDGPVGWVYTEEDPSSAAKALVDHIEDQRIEMEIRGALMGSTVLSKEQIEHLADLPGRDQLLGMLFGQMNAPISALARVLNGSIGGLATVLQAIADKGGAPADEAGSADDADDEAEAAAEEASAAETTEETSADEATTEATEEPESEAAEETGVEADSSDEPAEAPAEEDAPEAEEPATEEPAEEAPGAEAEEESKNKPEGEGGSEED